MKKQIIAVQLIDNKLFTIKTEDYRVLTADNLILDMSLNHQEYYVFIDGKSIDFKISEDGKTIDRPDIKQLSRVIKF